MIEALFHLAIAVVLFMSLVMSFWGVAMIYRIWKGDEEAIKLHNTIMKKYDDVENCEEMRCITCKYYDNDCYCTNEDSPEGFEQKDANDLCGYWHEARYSLTEPDFVEIKDRFGETVAYHVRDMATRKNERWHDD